MRRGRRWRGGSPWRARRWVGAAVAPRTIVTWWLGGGGGWWTRAGPGAAARGGSRVAGAGRLEPCFAYGVRFADLPTVPAADLVAPAVALALVLNTSGAEVISDVMAYLRPRRLLLVLDNFEQVMGAAPLVAELLTAARGLVVVVTSRMVLRLSRAHDVQLPTLPVPATT